MAGRALRTAHVITEVLRPKSPKGHYTFQLNITLSQSATKELVAALSSGPCSRSVLKLCNKLKVHLTQGNLAVAEAKRLDSQADTTYSCHLDAVKNY